MAKQIETIADLQLDPHNANRGTERGEGLLETSIQRYGLGRSIVTDRDGVILAGNKTAQKAGELGLDRLRVVETDGTELVVVRRTDLEYGSPEATGLALADNRVSEVNLDFDMEQVRAFAEDGYSAEVAAFWWDEEIEVSLPDPFPMPEPDLESDHLIEIRCTAAFLQEKTDTLLAWAERDDCTINIS